ncbi:UNVERIFIED_ORG: hypothetical protein ABIC54_004805 [Burkholderia sp. 1263]
MNAQAASTDFSAELSSFIRRINTFDSFARSSQFGRDTNGLRPVRHRGMLPATVTAAVTSAQDGVANAVPCPESIRRLCTPTSRPRPLIVAHETRSPVAPTRENETSTKTAPYLLVTDGKGVYEVTVLTPEIVRCSEWKLDGDRIGTWSALFGPKSKYFEAPRGQELDRLRSYLSSLPTRKMQAAILTAPKAYTALSVPKLKPITIHALFLNNRFENVWTNVHLRLRPVQRTIDSQVGSDIWTFVDLQADSSATLSYPSLSTHHVLGE